MTTESGKQAPADGERQVPRVFLSYASENKELAGQVANTLMKNRIETCGTNGRYALATVSDRKLMRASEIALTFLSC